MTTNMRAAFERLADAHPYHPWVARRLRHLLDRSRAGTYEKATYQKGRDLEWGNLRPRRFAGTWRLS